MRAKVVDGYKELAFGNDHRMTVHVVVKHSRKNHGKGKISIKYSVKGKSIRKK